MFFPRSGVVAATLLVLQSTLSIAAPWAKNAVHDLEKRITCHTNEVSINNACVSCASLYKNATTCTRSVPLTCSYGVVDSARKCAAVDCSKTSGTYLSTDAKQCLPCTDPNALTCNSTTPFTCQANYTLSSERTGSPVCYKGNPYVAFFGWGLAKPFQSNQQPFKPTIVANGDGTTCIADHYNARVVVATPSPDRLDSAVTCTGQNGALDQNLVKTVNGNAVVFLKGYCSDYVKSSFVTANKAQGACEEGFVTPDGQVS
ncbi:BZ3500_MvSof-1268-A1-R1_Chr8-1g09745 [Microbotryum saponariae]|uniref:BZ3500_MvSof-1268-A1-R1_Chr8-1g09745 protein n=1 Tax=Microbotryum saponariae TaxID=289078 RepID=A0A2X0LLK7_9BASI|nr:BZ3500_MvSof-1268-A1-R1_Chr8-1g09745 [Microbotryum saponariae]SDA08031.1 BZ3501_MvSof-1269-A2-R1_Chr8-1g09468 [Microbotryum saponariae]